MNDLDPQEELEVQRLADALDAVEAGQDPAVDLREDPELASLLTTAASLRETWRSLAPAPDHVARWRSRALESMERSGGAVPAKVVPFYRRRSVLSPIASAAAAAAITFTITMFAVSDVKAPEQRPEAVSAQPAAELTGPARPPFVEIAVPQRPPADEAPAIEPGVPPEQLAVEALVRDLRRIESALAEIRRRAELGEPVDADLLRTVTEGTARVASQIAMAPESVSPTTVATYFQSVSPGREILNSAQVVEGDEAALETARAATWGRARGRAPLLPGAVDTVQQRPRLRAVGSGQQGATGTVTEP